MKLDLRNDILNTDKLTGASSDTIKFNSKLASNFVDLKSDKSKFELDSGFLSTRDERIKDALIKAIEERFYPGSGGLFSSRSEIESVCIINGRAVLGKSSIIHAIRQGYNNGELQILWKWRELVKIGIVAGTFETVVGYDYSVSNSKKNGYIFIYPDEVPLMEVTCFNGLSRVCSEIGIPGPVK